MSGSARDPAIDHVTARRDHVCYGMGLGIILLDDVYPGFPGDVRNASAFPFPIQYEICEGVDIQGLVFADDNSACLTPILRAARQLERMGCRAIAAECGYFACFQKDVAGRVGVPVFMSSLLQVPLIQQVIGPEKQVGLPAVAESQGIPGVVGQNEEPQLQEAADGHTCKGLIPPQEPLARQTEKEPVAPSVG